MSRVERKVRSMTFCDALHEAIAGRSVRRKGWENGIVAYVERSKTGGSYLATCHVAACELGGVREINDLLADDWEIYS